jgi:hypothetical protein
MDLMIEIVWLLLQLVLEGLSAVPGDAHIAIRLASSERFWLCVGAVAGGFVLGTVSGLVLPLPLLPAPRTRGISLVVNPILSGVAMHFWGSYRHSRGRSANALATLWVGGSFAFGCALGRFLLVA